MATTQEEGKHWKHKSSQVLQQWSVDTILEEGLRDGIGFFAQLPFEVLFPFVLGRLSPKELLCSLALTSRAFCLLANDDFLWKAHYSQRYKMFDFQLEGDDDKEEATPCFDKWKAFYASRVLAQRPFHEVELELAEDRATAARLEENRRSVLVTQNCNGDYGVLVVQANTPLRPLPGLPGGQRVGYFEATINNAGPGRLISLGLAIANYPRHHIGWSTGSFGYHGDDGSRFTNDSSSIFSCQGRKYHAGYDSTDVVGCGYNFDTNEIFFTQNGLYLGPAFAFSEEEGAQLQNEEGELLLRPSVGLAHVQQHVTFNFGGQPFVFNIDALILNFQVPEAPPFLGTASEFGSRHLSVFAARP